MRQRNLWSDQRGNGPVLVALHPGGTDSRSLEPLLDKLEGYHRIVVDRAGHGRSADIEGPWSLNDMADDIADVLASRAPDGGHIVGWSDGAIVGLAPGPSSSAPCSVSRLRRRSLPP